MKIGLDNKIAKKLPLFSLSAKINGKTANLSLLFEYLDVT